MRNTQKKESIETRIQAVLGPLIEEVRKDIYIPEAAPLIADAEVLGVIVAKYLKWEGTPIITAFLYALEDANLHTLEGQIEQVTGVSI